MKHLLSSLTLFAVTFSMVGCVDMVPGGYGAPPPPAYGPSYSSSPAYYNGYDRRPDYDHHDYPRPSNRPSDRNYYGGAAAWYQAGVGLGRRDRKEHVSPNYRRHKTQYDGRTEREFARGYNDGYNGR